jgi:hypothetical protein
MPNPQQLARVIDSIASQVPESKYIRAYHGSPHNFDRFDSGRIGTGEGQQAFGYGLYFADNEAVAKSYRDTLSSGRGREILVGGEPVPDALPSPRLGEQLPPRIAALRALRGAAFGDVDETSLLRGAFTSSSDSPDSAYVQRVWDELREMKRQGIQVGRPPGHMYEVEIGHPADMLLDLDSPVDAQSKVVRDALGEYAVAPKWFSMGQDGWRGDHAYTRMANGLAAANPRIIDGYHLTHDRPAASAALLQAGVPGIKYFDGQSKNVRDGTRNYVVFPGTEDSIRILRKYGLMAPMAAAAGGAASEPQAEVR